MSGLAGLLGKQLKDDELLELLERHDMKVIYSFDRLHENQPDTYWAAAKEAGFQLRFNAQRELDVIFCYLAEGEGFTPIDPAIIGMPIHESPDQVRSAAAALGFPIKEGLWKGSSMIRIDEPGRHLSYQFGEGGLERITLFSSL